MQDNEPSLHDISDFKKVDRKKSRVIWTIIIVTIAVISIILTVKIANNNVSDYIGTPKNPGINVTKD
jgi:uncharacterized integral membrane protein